MKPEAFRMEVGSPEWLAFRRTGIGASEVGSVLGVNPWKSAVDIGLDPDEWRTGPVDGLQKLLAKIEAEV